MTSETACRWDAARFRRQILYDRIARGCAAGAGAVVCLTLVAMAVFLLVLGAPLLLDGQWAQVLTWTWRPYQQLYGILPMVVGTLALATLACVLSWPLAVGISLLACGLGPHPVGRLALGVVTVMTAIPTVVYGFVSVFAMVPLLRDVLHGMSGPSWLAAGMTLAVLILPTMVLFLFPELQAAEKETRLTTASLGFSRAQALVLVALPKASHGLRMAAMLGACRAVSDTLIPLMLAGNAPQVPQSVFASIRTLTAHIALVLATDNSSPAFHSLFACGLLLFAVTTFGQILIRRRRGQETRVPAWVTLLGRGMRWPAVRIGLEFFCTASGLLVVTAIAGLFLFLLARSLPVLTPELFFGDTPVLPALLGRLPVWDGIYAACAGTLTLVLLASAMAIPVGMAAGISLTVAASGRIRSLLLFATNALAGVPSIVMGLFGFSMIIALRHSFAPDANTSLLLSAVCIALLVLPYMIHATNRSLTALPEEMRLLGAGLGMTQWQSLRRVQLPLAARGIMSGVVLSMGRAAEDTAVILLTGVVAHSGLPSGLLGKFEALPFTIYYLAAQYQNQDDLNRGFGAALILLALTMTLYGLARLLRATLEKQ